MHGRNGTLGYAERLAVINQEIIQASAVGFASMLLTKRTRDKLAYI
jgi:hypothetical protein